MLSRGTVTIGDALRARAASRPDAAAILSPGTPDISAGALADRMRSIEAAFADRGIRPRDRVAVLAGLGTDAAVAVLGTMGAATCVPVSPEATAELGEVLSRTRARALFVPGGAGPRERDIASRCGVMVLDGAERLHQSGESHEAREPDADDVALILRTSGSTSRPKLVPATHRQLIARARAAADFMELGPDDTCFCPMPLSYGHGIYTGLLFSLLAGGAVILPDSRDERAFRTCMARSPTWYTAGAAYQQAILGWVRDRGLGPAGEGLRFGRCANGALPPSLQRELEAVLGVRVLHTYGTSEAGMIASESPAGPRKEGTVGTPVGVEVAVRDGELAVRGPTVFSGYEDDPELNRSAFADGWWLTRDHGRLDEDGFLEVAGRLDDVINRGGEKVSPTEVEEAILLHPSVAQALVFPVPHPTLGEDLAAAVTPAPGGEPSETVLRAHLLERLASAKVPRRITVVPEIPRSPSGKPSRSYAAEVVGTSGIAEDARGPDVGGIEARLTVIWGECLERTGVGPGDDFFDLGGDSLSAIELISAIEEDLAVRLDPEDVVAAPTPRLLASAIASGSYLERPGSRGLAGVNLMGSRTPLFVVGGRPGYVVRLLLVGREIDPDQPVYGLQPPGMDWSLVDAATVPEMAAHYVELVRRAQPRGPYRLLGSSFGGLVAFEMGRQLEAAGEAVEFVAVIDTEPPRFSWRGPDEDSPPHALEDTELPFRASAGPGAAIAAAGARVHEAHAEARRTYEIPHRIACGITLFLCSGEGVAAGGDRRRLWRDATTGPTRLLVLPGLHARFDREPQFSALRDSLRDCLAGNPPAGIDPAQVFDRAYTLERVAGGEAIRDPAGALLPIEEGATQGRVRGVKERRGKLLVRGWAADGAGEHPAATVVAFVGGAYAGYSTCGAPTARIARRLDAPGLAHAGFRMRLDAPTSDGPRPTPRVFALTAAGLASELPVSR